MALGRRIWFWIRMGSPAACGYVRSLGLRLDLYLAYGKKDVAVRVPADSTIGRGDNANFSFRMDKVHIFDAYTQQRV